MSTRALRWGIVAVALGLAPTSPARSQDGDPAAPTPTFVRDIAPLIHRRCTGCHRPGEAAPFALRTYAEVRKRSRQILDVAEQRLMPPWRPEPDYGSFRGSRRLDDGELDLLRRWVSAGAPEGVGVAPTSPSAAEGWQLGPPDLVLEMPRAYTVRAEGRDVFRNFVIPIGNTQDRWLAAAELRPGNLRVVHHAFVTVDAQRKGRKMDQADRGPGFGGLDFGSGDGIAQVWAPGTQPHRFPDETGLFVPAGSDIVLQFHLQPNGAPEEVQATVGLYFHADPPLHALTTVPLAIRTLRIPAGNPHYETSATFPVAQDLRVLAIFPHMHALGREVQVHARTPDKREIPMVWIKDWNFGWQDLYQYAEPLLLPRGTVVRTRFVFDNSAENPEQPHDPPKVVTWGSQGVDEMALVLLQVVQPQGAKHKGNKGMGRLERGGR